MVVKQRMHSEIHVYGAVGAGVGGEHGATQQSAALLVEGSVEGLTVPCDGQGIVAEGVVEGGVDVPVHI